MTDTPQSLPRIYADFHNTDSLGRLRLNCAGTTEDLRKLRIELREGLVARFYMEDVQCLGTVSHSPDEGLWVAVIDWRGVSDGKPSSD